MGYYDDALEHSSGPWKKHKYIKKIGEGADAVYKYAKKAAGSEEREEYLKRKKVSDMYDEAMKRDRHDMVFSRNSARADNFSDHYKEFNAENIAKFQNNRQRWDEHGDQVRDAYYRTSAKTREAKSAYSKTPMGRIELSKTVQSGMKLINKLFGRG